MINKGTIYLDYNATTPLDQDAYLAMVPYLTNFYGNPSSIYNLGKQAKNAISEARKNVAYLMNAEEEEIIYTSGASESNSTILIGIALKNLDKKHIITSAIEHPAILQACRFLKEFYGFTITELPVNSNGVVEVDDVLKAINDQTCLVTIMMVNNEVGSVQPIEEIGRICYEYGIHFHCDAVQGAGKLDIDVKQIKIDSLSISAHKIYGPKGIGCLYIRDGIEIFPLIHGGSQEMGIRSGTENVPGIIGFGVAAKVAKLNLIANYQHIVELRDTFLEELKCLPDWSINGSLNSSVPSTLNIKFSGIRGEALAAALNQFGVCVSISSACSSSSSKLSYVLKAMGKSDDEIRSSVRISFGKYTTQLELIEAVNVISKLVTQLRHVSSKYSPIKEESVHIG
ncbi:cysteine desulfurase family protein (plasmid) [Metabacillus halosaccharovorans]|uniref:cysteine desulfurase family protein n=1 Tax=Metabacillus halosaccharovorans TaxID=930124 RepID=UPI00203C441C|nr:cysteine desulfurase family protein [Metabacillus halosaccharovorans]MCM3441339.1 cysteine desulfurase [Metabacillus halosaccharovorans]